MASTSPTALTLRELRSLGWHHQIVEYWHAHAQKRIDLFGFIDVLALTPEGILGIQATTRGNVSARRRKIREDKQDVSTAWLHSGGLIEIWGWDKPGKQWRLLREQITAGS